MTVLGTLIFFCCFSVIILILLQSIKADTASEGSKEILIQVIVPDEEVLEFTIITNAETLREALDEKKLIGEKRVYTGFYY